jgi:hypothetical protein
LFLNNADFFGGKFDIRSDKLYDCIIHLSSVIIEMILSSFTNGIAPKSGTFSSMVQVLLKQDHCALLQLHLRSMCEDTVLNTSRQIAGLEAVLLWIHLFFCESDF